MRRIVAAVTAALLSVTVLAGCGGDKDSSAGSGGYCSDLSSAKDSFVGLLDDQISQAAFDTLRSSLPSLTAEAPDSVKADWATFTTAVDAFSVAMTKAGLTMDDMQAMGSGGMSGMNMQTAMQAASALGSAKVSSAQSAIAANAQQECNLDLNS